LLALAPFARTTELSEKFPTHDHANLHSALDAEFSGADCSVATFGVINPHPFMSATLSMLVAPGKAGLMGGEAPAEGPVEYANITLDDDRVVACVQSGLFLVKRGGEPLAVLMSGPAKEFHPMAQVSIQVMAPDRDAAEKFLAGLRTAMRKRMDSREDWRKVSPPSRPSRPAAGGLGMSKHPPRFVTRLRSSPSCVAWWATTSTSPPTSMARSARPPPSF